MTIDTWRCEVCKSDRLDDDISVVTLKKYLKIGGSMGRNVKYCNDKPECLDGAVKIAKEAMND